MKTTTCKKCSAIIFFADTAAGNAMPLNAEPDEDGKFLLEGTYVRYATDDDPENGPRYSCHHATCQNYHNFRKGKA